MKKVKLQNLIMEFFAIMLALSFLIPFYFVISNSLKSFAEISTNPAGLPIDVTYQNFKNAWVVLDYPRAFSNSLIITIMANIGLVVISTMSAYRLTRHKSKMNKLIFGLFVAGMVVPFQSIMIPLVKISTGIGLIGSRTGLIMAYFGFGVALNTFLFSGFVKSIPYEIEQAAMVDGCSLIPTYYKIVLPLLKPMMITVVILNSLWIWNDYLLPVLFLNDRTMRTIPIAMKTFFEEYTKQWDLALAGLIMGVGPMIIFFLLLQKHIIRGIAAGSVKG